MFFALIPAAGKSMRMGRPKLSLPVAGRMVLEHTIAALRDAGVGPVLVVIGPHVPELAAPAEAAGAHVLLLPKETPDMRTTVERGLDSFKERYQPASADAWFLLPADHPTLEPETIRDLMRAAVDHPECTIFVPAYRGQRGHPVLVRWKHVSCIRALPAGLGINAMLRQCAAETLEVPTQCPDVLRDLDTPEGYEFLVKRPTDGKP